MNCDLFMQNIDAYFDDELPESQRLAFEEHKDNCVECNLLFESYKEMLTSLNAMDEMDIPFPDNLHENIMKSVYEVAEQDAKSESDVSNVIDITNYINKNTENTVPSKKNFFTSHKTNTLVAGLLTVFVATGAYKTYDTYNNNSVLDDGMLSVELPDDNSVADSKAQDAQVIEDTQDIQDIQDNDQNTTVEPAPNENNVGDSTNLATTTQENTKANEVTEATSTNDNATDSSLATEVSTFSVNSDEPVTNDIIPEENVVKSSPKAKVVPLSTEADIAVTLSNNTDYEQFMNYLRNAPALNIHVEDNSQSKVTIITVSSDNIEKLVDYIDNYPDGEVVVEYLNESLKNLNTNTNFKLKVVSEE